MIVGVVGSRSWTDKYLLFEALDERYQEIDEIISGGADGADTLAREYVEENNASDFTDKEINLTECFPDYKSHGKSAPLIRNKQIVDLSDIILAFWDGKSTGTMHTIKEAVKQGKPFIIYGKPQVKK